MGKFPPPLHFEPHKVIHPQGHGLPSPALLLTSKDTDMTNTFAAVCSISVPSRITKPTQKRSGSRESGCLNYPQAGHFSSCVGQ